MNIIEEFILDQEANSIGHLRIRKYRTDLNIIRRKYYEKGYENLATEDLKDIIRKIEASDYAEWTKHDLKVIIRKFVKWLNLKCNKNVDTSFVSIKMKNSQKLPEEILKQEETLLKFNEASVKFPSTDKLKFEMLMIDFLKELANRDSEVKNILRNMIKERGLEKIFE